MNLVYVCILNIYYRKLFYNICDILRNCVNIHDKFPNLTFMCFTDVFAKQFNLCVE